MALADLLPREVHGIAGPVVHQLVQVVGEGALAAGGHGRGLAGRGLAAHCSPHRVGAAGPCEHKHTRHRGVTAAPRASHSAGNGTPGVKNAMQINSEFRFQDTLKWELQGLLRAFSQSVSQRGLLCRKCCKWSP